MTTIRALLLALALLLGPCPSAASPAHDLRWQLAVGSAITESLRIQRLCKGDNGFECVGARRAVSEMASFIARVEARPEGVLPTDSTALERGVKLLHSFRRRDV